MTFSDQSANLVTAQSGGLTSTRPREFGPEVYERLFARLAEGESLVSLCREDEFPSRTIVYKHVASDAELRAKFTLAMDQRAEVLAEAAIVASEAVPDGSLDSPTFNARQRLIVDTKKWAAATLAPKKYSQKVAIGGAEDLPPIKSISEVVGTPEDVYRNLLTGGTLAKPPADDAAPEAYV